MRAAVRRQIAAGGGAAGRSVEQSDSGGMHACMGRFNSGFQSGDGWLVAGWFGWLAVRRTAACRRSAAAERRRAGLRSFRGCRPACRRRA